METNTGKHYAIPYATGIPDWSAVPAAPLLPCRWSPESPPAAEAKAVWTEGALLVRLESFAAPTRAVNTAPDSAVWEDSCLEFFFSADGQTDINLEANANAALRASIGPDRHERRFLRELDVPLPQAEAETTAAGWALTLRIPAALLEALLGVTPRRGLRLRGNFYSCGDKTPAPHYAAWSPVETPSPDFHRPEFFGTLELTE